MSIPLRTLTDEQAHIAFLNATFDAQQRCARFGELPPEYDRVSHDFQQWAAGYVFHKETFLNELERNRMPAAAPSKPVNGIQHWGE